MLQNLLRGPATGSKMYLSDREVAGTMAKTEGSGAFTPDQLHIIDCALKHLEANLILDQARRRRRLCSP